MTPQQILLQYFGYSEFRSGQLEIVNAIIDGHETLAIMPTGGGKSICFQVPGLALEGTTIVVSPLISLMKDQVDTLNRRGIPATFINSSLEAHELRDRLQKLQANQWKFVYVAPERLLSAGFMELCQKILIPLIAVDEAHCISQWGHDFRPEYFQIEAFISCLSNRPRVAAFTATATKKVIADIIFSLKLREPRQFLRSFQRTNLTLKVIPCATIFEKQFFLIYLLRQFSEQSGVIYCLTRVATEELVRFIQALLPHVKVASYHGGLTTDQRTVIQEQFLKNEIDIIVATNAFGMGVDKPNVRYVIHYHLPTSLEHYYQEAGRAGRDQQPAECFVLHRQDDLKLTHQLAFGNSPLNAQYRHHINHQLRWMKRYATTKKCRTGTILEYFGEGEFTAPCGACDRCLNSNLEPQTRDLELYQQIMAINKGGPPITKKIAHWVVLTQPLTRSQWLAIPGIGRGWIAKCHQHFSHIFTQL